MLRKQKKLCIRSFTNDYNKYLINCIEKLNNYYYTRLVSLGLSPHQITIKSHYYSSSVDAD